MTKSENKQRATRIWPERKTHLEGDELATNCGACGLHWLVDRSLAGYRLRCECGSWVGAPSLPRGPKLGGHPRAKRLEYWYDDTDPLEVGFREASLRTPEPEVRRTVQRDRASVQRQASRGHGTLELVTLLLVFFLPALGLSRLVEASGLPWLGLLSTMATGLLILLVSGRREQALPSKVGRANWRHLAEANLASYGAAAGLIALAPGLAATGMLGEGLVPLMESTGLAGALVGAALVPALIEEYAFRGVLQGRMAKLFGSGSAVLISGAAFALAHGSSLYLPAHLLLGLYLGWLRQRSQSLAAPMLMHFLFNGLLVMGHYFGWQLPVVG